MLLQGDGIEGKARQVWSVLCVCVCGVVKKNSKMMCKLIVHYWGISF